MCLNGGEVERGDIGDQQATKLAADMATTRVPVYLSVPLPSGELRFPTVTHFKPNPFPAPAAYDY